MSKFEYLPTNNAYTAVGVGGQLRESLWRGGIGYTRIVPLNNTSTDVNWTAAPAWSNCCSELFTTAQGGDILSSP